MWTLKSDPSYASIGEVSATAIAASPPRKAAFRHGEGGCAGCRRTTRRTIHSQATAATVTPARISGSGRQSKRIAGNAGAAASSPCARTDAGATPLANEKPATASAFTNRLRAMPHSRGNRSGRRGVQASMRRVSWRSAPLLLVSSILLAACTGAGSGGPIAHPAGDRLVLRVTTQGGFIGPGVLFTSFPGFSLLGDGRVMVPGAQIELYPGPALPAVNVRRLTEAGIQAVLDEVLKTGYLRLERGVSGRAERGRRRP